MEHFDYFHTESSLQLYYPKCPLLIMSGWGSTEPGLAGCFRASHRENWNQINLVLHLVSKLRTPSSNRHRIRLRGPEPFCKCTPLLNATLKGKKKSNGNFQSTLGWPLGGSGFWVMSTKFTRVVKETSISCSESCRKKANDSRLVLSICYMAFQLDFHFP